ncbi:glutamine--fructose-6-phosphate transaminase (isomerizing) [Haloarchaeobius baliensis]|uniref:glutamine--fructose-6-phosphate transaminase (isomerizing) n=1 Tax=Haloarchaeobius baliensis TaxID=1670458 RepID=UPI003F884EC3
MCGIIGCVGTDETVPTLMDGLSNLEYRGYDSAGVAVQNGKGIATFKRSGKVAEVRKALPESPPSGTVGIGHTRWSTHGPPTDQNAHPHTDPESRVAVVHNGVIENYDTLRAELEATGNTFVSDTDTEVIPHLVAHYLDQGDDHETAFRRTLDRLDGSYAVAAIIDGDDTIYCARHGTPLVVGIGDGSYFLASDVPAFLERTSEVVYLEDGEIARIEPDGFSMMDVHGDPIETEIEHIDWDPKDTGKGAYDHYMLKEIDTQPTALKKTLEGRIEPETGTVSLDGLDPGHFEEFEQVDLVACGTSYHAALYGAKILQEAGIEAQAHRASEYGTSSQLVSESTLAIPVTQSGETADTLSAMADAAEAGATTVAVTNVMGSTVARQADETVFIRAGPEIGVAATKTFSSQVVTLLLLARRLAEDMDDGEPREDFDEVLAALDRLPDDIQHVLESSDARSVAHKHIDSDAFLFIGRHLAFPVAKEGALKFKEITYEHAESFTSGRLKHGPLALVTPSTPIFAVATGEVRSKTLTNATEAKSRGAPIVLVTDDCDANADLGDYHLEIPETHELLEGLLANVQLQLVSYYAANRLDREIDKPRNLAKSVTVE